MELAFRTTTKDTARFSQFLSFLLTPGTALTFVPMWKRKERKRGYNQAALIAKEISVISGNSLKSLLEKTKDTKPQTDLDKKERLENVKDSFRYLTDDRGFIADGRGYSISGNQQISAEIRAPQNVVLVDDVWTTGATMKECCKVLKKAGVEKVWGFTLARTT
jgi:competence protein ComFC